MEGPFSLRSTYLYLRPVDGATAMEDGETFWKSIERRSDLDAGRLVSASVQTADWDHWERHPAGDEILILLSGRLEIVMETVAGERRVTIEAGQTFVIAKGHWHRAIVHKASELIFITPGHRHGTSACLAAL